MLQTGPFKQMHIDFDFLFCIQSVHRLQLTEQNGTTFWDVQPLIWTFDLKNVGEKKPHTGKRQQGRHRKLETELKQGTT